MCADGRNGHPFFGDARTFSGIQGNCENGLGQKFKKWLQKLAEREPVAVADENQEEEAYIIG
jgi:hypothetical protein